MILTLIKSEHITTTVLPEKVNGQFWIKDTGDNGRQYELVTVEGIDGGWYLNSGMKASIVDRQGRILQKVKLENLNFYELCINENNVNAVIFAEPVTNDRNQFNKYSVLPVAKLSVGRLKSNEIVFDNQLVSSCHATLEYDHGNWYITDNGSRNGTFVNGNGINGRVGLYLGDVVYIMGLKIIIGNGFFAVNNPDGQVFVLSNMVFLFKKPQRSLIEDKGISEAKKEYLYRPPRFKREILPKEFKIDAPPNNQIGEEMPMLLMIGPSATMGMAALTTGIFAITNAISNGNITAAIPSAVMSLSMLLGTVMWPIVSRKFEKKRKRRKEAKRQEKYSEYLQNINRDLDKECVLQSEILRENNLTLNECIKLITTSSDTLWERNRTHNDFLSVRLGLGELPLVADIKFPERRFGLDEDNLLEDMYHLCETEKTINDVPIAFSFLENYITGIYGDSVYSKAFINGLLIKITAMFGYDDVKLAFIYDDKCFDFVKWFPHTWDNDGRVHLIATDFDELKELSAHLDRIISQRKMYDENAIKKCSPYYLIFSFSPQLSLKSETLKQLYSLERNINISVINFCESLQQLPKECGSIIEVQKEKGFLLNKNNITGKAFMFKPDEVFNCDLRSLSVKLANVFIDDPVKTGQLPQLITFLEMFNVGKVEHLNALVRWNENDPTKSLQAPIGVNAYGDIFYLDLHEKFHGPHGLVAGMTGSGKSEFIITYILSLALNYSPKEVAFILIDYKGGGMAKAFEKLPHVAGIITNLDGAAIKRSLVSIESELKHRQTIFANVSKMLGISNIDIYKYQKAYRDGLVSEPLPHLFIISDEFAELKTQQQEFMTQLISAARIGRSLGVHLILATQKPSGVVDDQIWSNSRFRICLKVQERSDSMDMLKRPDAAELSDTGRFYLQVGYNELFELGQSAWAGAPYYPSNVSSKRDDIKISIIDNSGHVVQTSKKATNSQIKNPQKQLDAVTNYLAALSESENIKVKPLWLEPISSIILLDELCGRYALKTDKYVLEPVVGEYDIPAKQSRNVLTVPITESGNAIVYGANGSGKTTFIATMLYSMISAHSACDLNLYILDFASETLKAFEKAPQVGDVILSYESEKIGNLFKMLKSEIIIRKKLFSDFGGDYLSYCSQSDSSVANIVVVINNYAVFSEMYEACEDDVMYLTREGAKYGIHFVISATGTNAVRYKLLQNFAQTFVLQMNDEMDYTGILGNVDGVFPSKIKGRGVIKRDSVYEFQTAYCVTPDKMYEHIREYCADLQLNSDSFAVSIPILPQKVDASFFESCKNTLQSTPIGISKSTLQTVSVDLSKECISVISSVDCQYLSRFVQGVSEILSKNIELKTTVYDFDCLYSRSGFENYNYINEDAESETVKLFNMMVKRHKELKNDSSVKFDEEIFIFPSFSSFSKYLSADGLDKLNVLLDKATPSYGMYFVICDIASDLQKVAMNTWYRNHCDKGDGIWVGDGVNNQYQLKISKMSGELNREIGDDFGYVIKNGKYMLCKLIQPDTVNTEDEING